MKRIILKYKSLILVALLISFNSILFEASREHFFHEYLPEHADGYFTYRKLMPECAVAGKTAEHEEDPDCPFDFFLYCLEQFSHYNPNVQNTNFKCVGRLLKEFQPELNSGISCKFDARAPPSV